jgi:hypothetical protein
MVRRKEVKSGTHLDVDSSEFPARLAEPLRRRPMRRLIVLVPLRPSFVRVLPSLLEQLLVIHDSHPNSPRDLRAPLHRNNSMAEGSVEFVEGEETEGDTEEGEEDSRATRGRVRGESCAEGAELGDGETPAEDLIDFLLEAFEALLVAGFAGEGGRGGRSGRSRCGWAWRRLSNSGRRGKGSETGKWEAGGRGTRGGVAGKRS